MCRTLRPAVLVLVLAVVACKEDPSRNPGGGDGPGTGTSPGVDRGVPGEPAPLPKPACNAADGGGSKTVAAPVLERTLLDRWHEAWLGSPAVADLDGDGKQEVLVPRDELLLGWHADGAVVFRAQVGGRIWASPVVADLVPSRPGLEVAVAARDKVYLYDAKAQALPGFPVTFRDELRAIAAGDVDGDGKLELVVVASTVLSAGSQKDIVMAYRGDGSVVPGFPPNTSGAAGCDDHCYVTGGFDQTLALGDVSGDGKLDILAPQDNAYMSLHEGTGRAFDAAAIFKDRKKLSGVRFLHDYSEAQQGWAENEDSALQAHFTNSAPAIVDLDGDGKHELVVLGSVQNAAQTDRLKGVGLWALHPDGTRPAGWTTPFHASDYLAGLWDFEGTNVVAATNQVAVADLDPTRKGPELVFAGFDGRIHCVDAARQEVWKTTYTTDARVLTGGVAIADLSGDGVPELVFNTYSPDEGKGKLFVLDAAGNILHQLALPKRGAMPVPTIADLDGDGALEIVVSLKDGEDKTRQVLIYGVAGSSSNCLPWPTGRGNLRRDGYVP